MKIPVISIALRAESKVKEFHALYQRGCINSFIVFDKSVEQGSEYGRLRLRKLLFEMLGESVSNTDTCFKIIHPSGRGNIAEI
jgi:hypothetical protein